MLELKVMEKNESPLDLKCKVVFLGAAGSGKTSIISRFMQNEFDKDYSTTIGIDFVTKPVQVQNRTVNLQIWDTAGQERYKSLIPTYIRDSSIAVLVYDVSVPSSLEDAIEWHRTVIDQRGNDAICILVGNKVDLEASVSSDEVTKFAHDNSLQTVETSAKTGFNIQRLFKLISESVPGVIKPPQNDVPVILVEPEPERRSQCPC